MGCFIYILDSSDSSSFTCWSSKLASSSRSNWTGIRAGNSYGIWTDKQSFHFITAKEISVKGTLFFMEKAQKTFFEMMLKCCWNPFVFLASKDF